MSTGARRRSPSTSLAYGQAVAEHFRPPWSVEESRARRFRRSRRRFLAGCFVVKAQGGRQLAYVYYKDSPGRRMIARLLSRDEARSIAVAISKLPEMV
jgi:hypothetical protein